MNPQRRGIHQQTPITRGPVIPGLVIRGPGKQLERSRPQADPAE